MSFIPRPSRWRTRLQRYSSSSVYAAIGGIVLKAAGMGFWFLFTVFSSYALGQEGFGHFIYVVSFYLFVAPIANFGYPPLLVRYGKEMMEEGDHRGASRLLWRSVISTIVIGVVAAILMKVLTDLGAGQLYGAGLPFYAVFTLGTVLVALQALFRNAQMAFSLPRVSNLHFYLYRNLFPLVICAGLYLAGLVTVPVMVAGVVGAYVVIVALDVWTLRRILFPSTPAGASADSEIEVPANWFTWISESASTVLARGDILFVAYFLGVEQTAAYFVAQRVAVLVAFGADGARAYMAPRLSEAFWGRTTRDDRNRMLDEVAAVYFVSIMVCGLPLLILAPLLLSFFAVEAHGLMLCSYVLIVGRILIAFLGPNYLIMDFCNLRAHRGIISIVALVAAPFVYGLFTQYFGIVGAGLAYSLLTMGTMASSAMFILWSVGRWPGIHLGQLNGSLIKILRDAATTRGKR